MKLVNRTTFKLGAPGLILALIALAAVQTLGQQGPPESREIQAARKIDDLNLRLRELNRIKEAYPHSSLLEVIDRNILDTRVGLCDTVEDADAIQRPLLSRGTGFERLDAYYFACSRILDNPKFDRFDKDRVAAVIESYVADYLKAAADPQVTGEIPADQKRFIASYTASLYLFEARAGLGQGRADKVRETLAKYVSAGGPLDAGYSYYSAEAAVLQARLEEALEDYLTAAVDNYRDSDTKARALWSKLKGTMNGFEARLEEGWRTLPYRPERFGPAGDGKGKTVLAELFTGSECAPCVAADLGFDGLLEAAAPRTVAVLEYHLPIPRPDPLMNPATGARQAYYGISSTPTTVFDGEKKFSGGGGKDRATLKFKQFADEIGARTASPAEITVGIVAARRDGRVHVECTVDRTVPGADCNVALVEKEVRYRGSNGIVFHKMVVRDSAVVNPIDRTARAVFDLADIESRTASHLAAFEKEQSFVFKEKMTAIDPTRLAVVFFVQDKATKKVLNAAFAEVK